MSRGLNKLMIIGHLGRDPEMRYTPSGRPVTTFSVATSRSWHSADGERHEETDPGRRNAETVDKVERGQKYKAHDAYVEDNNADVPDSEGKVLK